MYQPARKLNNTSVVTQWVTEAERTGETDFYPGKRQWPRTTWAVSLVVKTLTGRQSGELVYARSKDVSLGGIAFFTRRKFLPHTEIEICAEGYPQAAAGKVVHCTRTLNGYFVGVVFDVVGSEVPRRSAG